MIAALFVTVPAGVPDGPIAARHLVEISSGMYDGYTAECSCGWRSEEMASNRAAWGEANTHYADAAGVPDVAAALRPYLRHMSGCQMLASHVSHELVCTCGLDAIRLESGSCAADEDGASSGHHESVGERQGWQPDSNAVPDVTAAEERYDSRPETQAHIDRVRHFLVLAENNLVARGDAHDASKLVPPEVEAFDIATPKLASLVYGSPEYKQSTDDLGPALDHHYAHNDHHPQHYENGVRGMSLMALIEMLCDWRAASERGKQRTDDPEKVKTFEDGLAYQQERFGYSDELAEILRNTVRELGL